MTRTIVGPPITSDEHRRRLCLWLLDEVRQHLPKNDRELAQAVYQVEARLNETRPHDPYAQEQIVRYRFMRNGFYLREGMFTMPAESGKPDFDSQVVVAVPCTDQRNYVRLEVESQMVPLP